MKNDSITSSKKGASRRSHLRGERTSKTLITKSTPMKVWHMCPCDDHWEKLLSNPLTCLGFTSKRLFEFLVHEIPSLWLMFFVIVARHRRWVNPRRIRHLSSEPTNRIQKLLLLSLLSTLLLLLLSPLSLVASIVCCCCYCCCCDSPPRDPLWLAMICRNCF